MHVVDASSEDRQVNTEQVNNVLEEIGADEVPQLEIYNKIDLMEDKTPYIERDGNGRPVRVWVSALQGEGLELILQAVTERLQSERVIQKIGLPPSMGKLHARLYALGAVIHEEVATDGFWLMELDMPRQDWDSLCKHYQINEYILPTEQSPCLAAGGEAQ